jgi:outer membrane cobalamin receptor
VLRVRARYQYVEKEGEKKKNYLKRRARAIKKNEASYRSASLSLSFAGGGPGGIFF